MALKSRLELRQQQRLALTPSVRIRLSILRMAPLDLAEEVAREAARNPFLRYDGPRVSSSAEALPDTDQAAPEVGFQEDLRRQLALQSLPPDIAALAEFLVGELRDDGLLDTDLGTLSDELGLPVPPLETALRALQACDPAGVGARTLSECLGLQLIDKGLTAVQAQQTLAHLPAFAARDWAALRAATGLDEAALQTRADLLRRLSPRPVAERPLTHTAALRPDLRLERQHGGMLRIAPDETARPRLSLDAALVRRAEVDGFAPDLLARAKALIDAVDQRGRTLSRIADWLVETQSGFFAHGPQALAPASRAGLAAVLGVHPSTISRAVSGKAIDVDGRLWPLSVFFSSSVAGAAGPVSARAVQKRLADLILGEAGEKPYSDEALVEKLNAEGIDIARRTVAKYRQGLRIPSSSARRRLAAAKRKAGQGA